MPQTDCPVELQILAHRHSWAIVRRLGLRPQEQKDIHQDLHLALWLRLKHYDAARGKSNTYLCRVLRNESEKIVAHRTAQCRDYRKCVAFEDCIPRQRRSPGRGPFRREEKMVIRIDVNRAVRNLPPDLRRIAFTLQAYLPSEAVAILGFSRARVYRLIAELRSRFKRLGLDEYPW
jgi:RNA polymerase sigma-70 factor (ECF subfamily)